METAKKIAERVEPRRKVKHSDSSSSDELENSNVSFSEEENQEKVPKKSEKKTYVPKERRAQVINQFTFSVYINMI